MKIEPQFDPHRRTITAFAIRAETISIGVSRSTKIERMIWNDIQTIEYSADPGRWLKSGALLLAVHNEWTRNGGDFSEGSETVTIAFNVEHKVSIQLGILPGMLETN